MSSIQKLALVVAACAEVARGGQFLKRKEGGYKQVLHNYQNVQYYADFKIGGQDIAGIFDTGSFELLVRSSRCEKCVHPTPPYDRTKSSSYIENGTFTKHVFGSGPCVSMKGYDTVSVGNMDAKGQSFWEIMDHRIQVLDSAKFAAIVGIGPNFAYGNTDQTLLMSYGVDQFSVCLQKEQGAEGFLTWGPGKTVLEEKDTAVANVIGKHHWAAKLEDVSFVGADGKNFEIPCSNGNNCTAIVDSGTSLIAAPGIALEQLSAQIPPIAEDCSNLHELPTLRFVVGGNLLELPPQAYVMKVTGATLEANDVWDILFFKPKVRKINMFMPAFMQIDMESQHGPVWILGVPFFRYNHTTFDRTNTVMRFAKAGPDCEPEALKVNKTSLISERSELDHTANTVDIDSLISPTLSGMMDFPYKTNGIFEL